ncbi:hypothetical protein DSECCO2_527270 [anaerobic digester metagenome]
MKISRQDPQKPGESRRKKEKGSSALTCSSLYGLPHSHCTSGYSYRPSPLCSGMHRHNRRERTRRGLYLAGRRGLRPGGDRIRGRQLPDCRRIFCRGVCPLHRRRRYRYGADSTRRHVPGEPDVYGVPVQQIGCRGGTRGDNPRHHRCGDGRLAGEPCAEDRIGE